MRTEPPNFQHPILHRDQQTPGAKGQTSGQLKERVQHYPVRKQSSQRVRYAPDTLINRRLITVFVPLAPLLLTTFFTLHNEHIPDSHSINQLFTPLTLISPTAFGQLTKASCRVVLAYLARLPPPKVAVQRAASPNRKS